MEIILNEIKKGNHPLMMNYIEFSYDERFHNGQLIRENTISPSHYSPLKVIYENNEKITDGWVVTQGFWDFKTWDDFMKHYMRMVRTGKQNYLKYYELTYDMTSTLMDLEYICSTCDNQLKGERYICEKHTDIDICNSCYVTNNVCPCCNNQLLLDKY